MLSQRLRRSPKSMQLHIVQPSSPRKYPRARVGRGGKRGTYSGRGTKGQRARSGHRIRPGFRDYIQRLPKRKGEKNKSLRTKRSEWHAVVNLDAISKKVAGEMVTPESLIAAKLIRDASRAVKVLGRGTVTRALTLKGLEVSHAAQEKILAVSLDLLLHRR